VTTQPKSTQHAASPELFDEMLIVMAQAGDRGAGERLFGRWNPRLLRAARRYCGEEEAARDLVQDSWLAIWKGLGALRDARRFRAFAFSVLYRRGADHLRKVIRERDHLAAQADQLPSEAEPPRQSDALAIAQSFAQLPPDQRLAAHLYFVEGLTLGEIATVQRVPEGTAKSRLFHARRTLKAALS